MTPPQVVVVDYGIGNVTSVAKAFATLNVDVVVSSLPKDIQRADRIVLPGVGAFGEGMRNLRRLELVEVLADEVREKRKPLLGICLGMQLLFSESVEHGRHEGLGWVGGTVEPFHPKRPEIKTLHIGWADVAPDTANPLFAGVDRAATFYFVHGYHVVPKDPGVVAAYASYGDDFVAAIRQDNVFGVQFHPEKSQETGLRVLRNFLRWSADREEAPRASEMRRLTGLPKVRLIPTLLLHRQRLVKTIGFELVAHGIRRDVGDPVKAPMVYDAQLADELVLLDIRATVEGRGIGQLLESVQELGGRVFMPLTVGGGIRGLEDIRTLLYAGADKVAINSAAVSRLDFVKAAAETFGNQCIVASVDVRRSADGRYEVFTHSGTRATGLDPVRCARELAAAGAGEILLTSIDRDGTMQGYDLDLIRTVAEAVNVPVIASGGAGTTRDLVEATTTARAAAAAAASIFHFRDISPIKAKASMKRAGLPLR